MGSLVGDHRRWLYMYILCHSNQQRETKDVGVELAPHSHQKLYLIPIELRMTMQDIESV